MRLAFFMAIGFWVDHINVLMTLRFGGFMLWATLFLVAFLFRDGWKAWGVYLLCTLVFSGLIYIGKIYNPIV